MIASGYPCKIHNIIMIHSLSLSVPTYTWQTLFATFVLYVCQPLNCKIICNKEYKWTDYKLSGQTLTLVILDLMLLLIGLIMLFCPSHIDFISVALQHFKYNDTPAAVASTLALPATSVSPSAQPMMALAKPVNGTPSVVQALSLLTTNSTDTILTSATPQSFTTTPSLKDHVDKRKQKEWPSTKENLEDNPVRLAPATRFRTFNLLLVDIISNSNQHQFPICSFFPMLYL